MNLKRGMILMLSALMVLSAAGCTQKPAASPTPGTDPTPQSTAKSADIVVVGGGLAGVSAAIKARENGASVILIEKQDVMGGSSALSGGGIGATETAVQQEYGIEDHNADWLELWHQRQDTSRVKSQYPDYDRVEALIRDSHNTIDWFQSLGYEFRRPEGFGVDPVERLHYNGPEGNGSTMMKFLSDKAQEKGVEVLTGTRAVSLIQNDQGEITGVTAEDKTGTLQLDAKAVILACGGFAHSQQLLERFTPEAAAYEKYSVSGAGNTGDGVNMAEAVGAALYEEPWLIGLGLTTPVNAFKGFYWYGTYAFVSHEGARFTNEAGHYALVFNDAVYESEGGSYMIFDSGAAFSAFAEAAEANLDNEFVHKGETLEELAEATGMKPEVLQASIDQINAAASGEADPFGKPAQVSVPMQTGPYYAVDFFPSSMGTFGGVKCDDHQQVLNTEDQPIVGLYAAGEMANKPYYAQVYMSGSALLVATTTGQVAGEAAAAAVK